MEYWKQIRVMKAHGLVWQYYKTITGNYRYITPKTGQDRGPFKKLKDLRDNIRTFGANINWQ